MAKINYPVRCPLLNDKEIEEGICFDIHMVVSGEAPKFTAPEEIYENIDYEDICMKCKYHRFD